MSTLASHARGTDREHAPARATHASPATGAQLYRLNLLGLLDEALEASAERWDVEGQVCAAAAGLVLAAAVARGEWTPPQPRRMTAAEHQLIAVYNATRSGR